MTNTNAEDMRRIVNLMEASTTIPTVELSTLKDNSTRDQISAAWPNGVLYHGEEVFDFYIKNVDSI